jgi:hypothetical protein
MPSSLACAISSWSNGDLPPEFSTALNESLPIGISHSLYRYVAKRPVDKALKPLLQGRDGALDVRTLRQNIKRALLTAHLNGQRRVNPQKRSDGAL